MSTQDISTDPEYRKAVNDLVMASYAVAVGGMAVESLKAKRRLCEAVNEFVECEIIKALQENRRQ